MLNAKRINENIEEILSSAKTIAVVGMSNNPAKESYLVGMFLKDKGYQIIPVNPNYNQIGGIPCYPDLMSIPDEINIDVVDIFRKPDDVLEIIEASIKRKISTIWMQLGIINEYAANLALSDGLDVVMDRCMLQEYNRIND